jgi:hypothetical protein
MTLKDFAKLSPVEVERVLGTSLGRNERDARRRECGDLGSNYSGSFAAAPKSA